MSETKKLEKPVPLTDGVLLETRQIVKKFGEFAANDDITLTIKAGQIHALLGENGAGKSTLVKIIYGALQPTSGELRWHGKSVAISNPAAARRLGIGMVFQHFSLFEALTVAENIALALPGNKPLRDVASRVVEVSTQYGLPLEPSALVADLSVGERQRIEIIRCLLQEPRLLIMDEPTAVLTPQEAEQLFVTLSHLANEGCAILYISHRLAEVKRLCHDATILRHGKVVASVDPQQETAASLARLMVGMEVHTVSATSDADLGDAMLELNSLSMPADGPFGVALRKVNLIIRRGEVVAIAGVAGNGQSELFDAISGEHRNAQADAISIAGQHCGHADISTRRKLAVAFVPEERLGHGAVPGFALSENVILTRHACDAASSRGGLLQRGWAKQVTKRITDTFDVRSSKTDSDAGSLSGGNLQKFVVGRELDRQPQLVVVNQPTWGVDAGAAGLIRQALVDLARGQAAVLVISQDLDEIFEMADRIAVISRGELSQSYATSEIDLEQIGLLMAGAHEGLANQAQVAHQS